MVPEDAGVGATVTGSIHTPTPEKSMCLRTAASWESRSSTRPDIDPARRSVAAARATSKLKKVRKREVIVRIHYRTRSQIRSAHLRGFKTCQDIRAQAIHDVRTIALVLAHLAEGQIAVAIVLLPGVNVDRSPACGPECELPPASGGTHRASLPVEDVHALAETSDHAGVLSVKESTGEIHARRWANQPVDGSDPGGDRLSKHARGADMETRRDFDAAAPRLRPELEAPLIARAGLRQIGVLR